MIKHKKALNTSLLTTECSLLCGLKRSTKYSILGGNAFLQVPADTNPSDALGTLTVSKDLDVPLLMANRLALILMNVLRKVFAIICLELNVLISLALTSMFCC